MDRRLDIEAMKQVDIIYMQVFQHYVPLDDISVSNQVQG